MTMDAAKVRYNNWHLWLPDAEKLVLSGGPDLRYVMARVCDRKQIDPGLVTVNDIAKQIRLFEKERLNAILAAVQRPRKGFRRLPPVPEFDSGSGRGK